jgi:hypothetical protein
MMLTFGINSAFAERRANRKAMVDSAWLRCLKHGSIGNAFPAELWHAPVTLVRLEKG